MLPMCPKCGKSDQVKNVEPDKVIQMPQLSFLGRVVAATTGVIIPSIKTHLTDVSNNEIKEVKVPDAANKYYCKSCCYEFTVISSN